MKMISLQSGSNGNCVYVEAGGVKLLIDAGISGKSAEERLASHGIDIRDVNALLISHDHTDHISHSGIFQRKYGMPVYITKRSLAAAERCKKLGKLHMVCYFTPGTKLDFGKVSRLVKKAKKVDTLFCVCLETGEYLDARRTCGMHEAFCGANTVVVSYCDDFDSMVLTRSDNRRVIRSFVGERGCDCMDKIDPGSR